MKGNKGKIIPNKSNIYIFNARINAVMKTRDRGIISSKSYEKITIKSVLCIHQNSFQEWGRNKYIFKQTTERIYQQTFSMRGCMGYT